MLPSTCRGCGSGLVSWENSERVCGGGEKKQEKKGKRWF